MSGKKKVHRKVTDKKQQTLSPRKIDLKKEKEKVKFLGGLVAGTTAVQAELTHGMDEGLLNLEWNEIPNLEGLQITVQNIIQANILGSRLNATVQYYLGGLLDELDQADQDSGH